MVNASVWRFGPGDIGEQWLVTTNFASNSLICNKNGNMNHILVATKLPKKTTTSLVVAGFADFRRLLKKELPFESAAAPVDEEFPARAPETARGARALPESSPRHA